MTGKYTINAVDRAGVAWEVCMTDHGDSAWEVLDSLRHWPHSGRTYWVTITDDPERGDVEDELDGGS